MSLTVAEKKSVVGMLYPPVLDDQDRKIEDGLVLDAWDHDERLATLDSESRDEVLRRALIVQDRQSLNRWLEEYLSENCPACDGVKKKDWDWRIVRKWYNEHKKTHQDMIDYLYSLQYRRKVAKTGEREKRAVAKGMLEAMRMMLASETGRSASDVRNKEIVERFGKDESWQHPLRVLGLIK